MKNSSHNQGEGTLVKQLTDTEKWEIETKIKDEQERQQTLREKYPNPLENSKEASAITGFVSSNLWKYGFLSIILCLLAFNVFIFFRWRDFDYDSFLTPVVTLMLLFNHIAYYLTTKGWKSIVMKTVAWVWIVLGFAYFIWVLG